MDPNAEWEDAGGGLFRVRSDSAHDKIYVVDLNENNCTCTAWALARNRAKRDGKPLGNVMCKHITRIKTLAQANPNPQPRTKTVFSGQKKKTPVKSPSQKAKEAEVARQFAIIKTRETIKKQIEGLRKP